MSLGVKLKNILEYYQEQIILVMDVMFSTYYILKNEYNHIRELLNSCDRKVIDYYGTEKR